MENDSLAYGNKLKKRKEEEELIRLRKATLEAAYRNVFSTDDGQLVFWDLLNKTYVFKEFGAQNASAYAMEGKRVLGLYLLAQTGFTETDDGLKDLISKHKQNLKQEKKNG